MHKQHRLATLGLIAVSLACTAGGEAPGEAAVPYAVDCAHADTTALSVFAIDEFRRDLAIDTESRIAEHLDRFPELICQELTSDRHGVLSPIAFAAGHRPDAHLLFPLLIERGAQARDALPVAVWRGDSRVVPWLLEQGVDPDTGSALVLAAAQRDVGMVRRLLEAGADPSRPIAENNWIREDGRSALHHAAASGIAEMLRALLDAGADANATDHAGRTPLAVAIRSGKPGPVRLLFDGGAAPTRMRREEVTQLHRLAKRYRMQDIVDFIE